MLKPILAAIVLVSTPVLATEAQAPKRTILEQIDVPGSAYTTVVAITDVEPNATVERHTHPGTEMTYLLEGGGAMFIEGKSASRVRVGDHWQVPEGAPHYFINGPQRTRLLVTYVLEKGKPLATPLPEKPATH